MPRLNTIVGAFTQGEISPLLYGRMESALYKRGVAAMRNMVPVRQGPAVSRPGSTHTLRVPNQTNTKLHTFEVAQSNDFILAFFENLIKVAFETQILYGPNSIVNGEFSNGLTSWSDSSRPTADVDVVDGLLILQPSRHAGRYAQVEQVITIPDAGVDYDLRVVGDFNGPTVQEGVEIKIGTSAGAQDISYTILYNNDRFYNTTIVAPGTTTLFVTITALDWSADTGSTSTDSFVDKILFRRVLGVSSLDDIVTTYAAEDIDTLVFTMVPGENKAIITHNKYQPAQLTYDPTVPSLTFEEITFIEEPAHWYGGNFPATLEFHQGRSWWTGYPDNPETMNASKSNEYYDFSIADPLVPDDALEFTLSKKGLIQWLKSAKSLLLGTENEEFIITSEGGVIVHDDIQVDLQSAHGSSNVQPVLLGTECMFIPTNKREVRAMGYRWKESGWVADDITFTGEHLLTTDVVQTTASKGPNQALKYVLADGTLLGCLYETLNEQEKLVGWSKHEVAGAAIKSVTNTRTRGISVNWVATAENINGVPEIHIAHDGYDALTGAALMDQVTFQHTQIATDTVTGLEYLEGREVTIVIDGALYGTEIVTGGQVVTTKSGFVFRVGIPFLAELTTLPVRFYTSDGAYFHSEKRHNKIFVQLLVSALPIINGTRPPDRSASTPFNTVQPLTSKMVQVANLGWDKEARIEIKQDLPFPLTVIAVSGEMALEQL